jgi:hypothetical protein
MSLWPCPVCLVPQDDLWDTSKSYRRRTSKDSQAVINAARVKETFEEREELLKEQALRLINVSKYFCMSVSKIDCFRTHFGQ